MYSADSSLSTPRRRQMSRNEMREYDRESMQPECRCRHGGIGLRSPQQHERNLASHRHARPGPDGNGSIGNVTHQELDNYQELHRRLIEASSNILNCANAAKVVEVTADLVVRGVRRE
ncbi:hypothetical protein KCV00_g350, partial [Aureobasidium melanogenum]